MTETSDSQIEALRLAIFESIGISREGVGGMYARESEAYLISISLAMGPLTHAPETRRHFPAGSQVRLRHSIIPFPSDSIPISQPWNEQNVSSNAIVAAWPSPQSSPEQAI